LRLAATQPPEMALVQSIPQTRIPPPNLVIKICRALQAAYPAGDGSVTILRSMPPNSGRVRWLSASSNQ